MLSMVFAGGCGDKTTDMEQNPDTRIETDENQPHIDNALEEDPSLGLSEETPDIAIDEVEIDAETEEQASENYEFVSSVDMCGVTFQLPDGFYLSMDKKYDKYLSDEAGNTLHIAVSDYIDTIDEVPYEWSSFDHPVQSFGSGPLTYMSEIYQTDSEGNHYRMYVRCESKNMSDDEIVNVVETIVGNVNPDDIDMSAVMELPLTEYGTIDLYNE